jgi:hypothetical protein
VTEGRLASASAPDGAWRAVVDRCAAEVGPIAPRLLTAWREELDAVEARVDALERAAPHCSERMLPCVDGVHALVALASARLGSTWSPTELRDVASAVELAYRATRHHDSVADRDDEGSAQGGNRQHVLDGDWSITQAAVLVADVGPVAYRLLVRGYGKAQVTRLEPDRAGPGAVELLDTAAALGGHVAGVPESECALVYATAVTGETAAAPALSEASRVCRWALSSLAAESGRSFTPAAAR